MCMMNFYCNLPIPCLNKLIICESILSIVDHLIFVRGQAPNLSTLLLKNTETKDKKYPKGNWKQTKFIDQLSILRRDITDVCLKNSINAVTIFIGPTIASATEVYRVVFSNEISEEVIADDGLKAIAICKRHLIRFFVSMWQNIFTPPPSTTNTFVSLDLIPTTDGIQSLRSTLLSSFSLSSSSKACLPKSKNNCVAVTIHIGCLKDQALSFAPVSATNNNPAKTLYVKPSIAGKVCDTSTDDFECVCSSIIKSLSGTTKVDPNFPLSSDNRSQIYNYFDQDNMNYRGASHSEMETSTTIHLSPGAESECKEKKDVELLGVNITGGVIIDENVELTSPACIIIVQRKGLKGIALSK